MESRIQGCRGSLTLDELKTCVPHGTKWIDEGSLRCGRKKGRGRGEGEKCKRGETGRDLPSLANPFFVFLSPYPLSTPATQAKMKVKGAITRKSMLF